METKDYINTIRHFRTRAEYADRNGTAIYLQGIMSPQEALTAFQRFGNVKLMQEYVNGKRVVIWKKGAWNKDNLEEILSKLNFKE